MEILKNILSLSGTLLPERLLRVCLSNMLLSTMTNTVKEHDFITILAIIFSAMPISLTTRVRKVRKWSVPEETRAFEMLTFMVSAT